MRVRARAAAGGTSVIIARSVLHTKVTTTAAAAAWIPGNPQNVRQINTFKTFLNTDFFSFQRIFHTQVSYKKKKEKHGVNIKNGINGKNRKTLRRHDNTKVEDRKIYRTRRRGYVWRSGERTRFLSGAF